MANDIDKNEVTDRLYQTDYTKLQTDYTRRLNSIDNQ